ncbi:hypothetical protein ACMDCR_02690 [Labrys okinawensis]|uniref:hypothetical protein n=1 Tax=Labrys okinawensis TaxID=346911 RepID=UPI0039BC31DD
MHALIIKLTLPSLLILLASLVGRRWGEVVGGWVTGLPLTSGPVIAFLALQYGPDFAAVATNGSLVGAAAQALACIGYARLADRGWPVALFAGITTFALGAALLHAAAMPHWVLFLAALAVLTAALVVIPSRMVRRSIMAPPWWDLPARMVVVSLLVVGLTAATPLLGAEVSGVLAAFPIFAMTLAIFAHRAQGPAAARQVVRGMVIALFGFSCFFYVLGLLLVSMNTILAFMISALAALGTQALLFRLMHPGGRSGAVA